MLCEYWSLYVFNENVLVFLLDAYMHTSPEIS